MAAGAPAGSFTPPQGETRADFRAPIGAGLHDWPACGEGDMLAVAHGGVARGACHEFPGLPPSMLVPVTSGTATILHLDPAANGAAGGLQHRRCRAGCCGRGLTAATFGR